MNEKTIEKILEGDIPEFEVDPEDYETVTVRLYKEFDIKVLKSMTEEEQNETAVELAKRKARWIMANQGHMDIGCSVLREVVVEEDSND